MNPPSHRLLLRDLSLGSRFVIALFLVTIGVGYFTALIQMHFQHAQPGTLLPTPDDAVTIYHGQAGLSALERLLIADEGKPFNGSGSMRQTFTSKSGGWKGIISRRAKDQNISLRQAEEELRSERDGERLAVMDWIRSGADRKAYEENNHVLAANLRQHPITPEFMEFGPDRSRRVKIASIIEKRCARCHSEGASGSASQFPLENWEQVNSYCKVETSAGGMSLKKLAQTTHIHLLAFALVYGLTGFIFTFTSYPGWLRALLGPLPLLAQLVDICFWWLGRLDPLYAKFVVYSGGAVALGLSLHIVLSLFNLFGKTGKVVLVTLILAACVGGFEIKEWLIDPYLAKEAMSATMGE